MRVPKIVWSVCLWAESIFKQGVLLNWLASLYSNGHNCAFRSVIGSCNRQDFHFPNDKMMMIVIVPSRTYSLTHNWTTLWTLYSPHTQNAVIQLMPCLLCFAAMGCWTHGPVEVCCTMYQVPLQLSSYLRAHTTWICGRATLLILSLSAQHVNFTVNSYAVGSITIGFQNIRQELVCRGWFCFA